MTRQGRGSISRVVVGMVVALALMPVAAQGRVGGLDPSFGDGGSVSIDRESWSGIQVVPGSGGSTVVAGGFGYRGGGELTRFLPTGELDLRFGEGGHVSLNEEIDGLPLVASDFALDSQGRIVVFGTLIDSDQEILEPGTPFGIKLAASWAVVIRLRSDGALDSSFGEGRGFLRSDFGLRAEPSTIFNSNIPAAHVGAGAVDSNDRPILLLTAVGYDSPCVGHSGPAQFPRALVRLTANGSPDPAFGRGGVSPIWGTPPGSTLGIAAGDLPVANVGSEGCPRSSMVFRFGADGTPLAEFGDDGVRAYPGLALSVIEPTGGLILRLGRPATRVIRLAPNGDRDRTFGNRGAAAVSMPVGARRGVRPVAVDAEGRILLVGSLVLPKPRKKVRGKPAGRRPSRGFLVIGRLRANGRPDRSFGKRGWILTPVGRSRSSRAYGGLLDAQGRLLVLRSVSTTRRGPYKLLLTRYLLGPGPG